MEKANNNQKKFDSPFYAIFCIILIICIGIIISPSDSWLSLLILIILYIVVIYFSYKSIKLQKKSDKIVGVLCLIMVSYLIVGSLISLRQPSSRSKARDARRTSDMRQIFAAQEMYYSDNQSFFSTESQKGIPAIGNIMPALKDPLNNNEDFYFWQNNTIALDCDNNDLDLPSGQWFCAYARLENKKINGAECFYGAYFAVSQKETKAQGIKIVCDTEPTVEGDCTCF